MNTKHLTKSILVATLAATTIIFSWIYINQYPRKPKAVEQVSWEAPRRIPGETGTGYYRAIAANGSTVHAARGDGTIYYHRSTNEGQTWSTDTAIGTGTLYLEDPLVAEGSNVYIVYVRNTRSLTDWCCPRNVGDIFFRMSRDNGLTWEPERQLTTTRGAYRISITTSGSNVYAVWMDFRSENTWDLYYRRSVNNGSIWEPEVKLVAGTTSLGAGRPQITAYGNSVHVAWMDGRDNKPSCAIEGTYTLPQCAEVYYKRSTDGGITWGNNIRLTQEVAYSGRPEIAAGPSGAVLVSYDNAGDPSGLEEFVVRSVDNGTSWSSPTRLSYSPGDSTHSSLIFNGSTAHLAWFERRGDSTAGIYYRKTSDFGATWEAEERVGYMGGNLASPLLAATTNFLHAIWGDTQLQTQYNRRTLGITPSNTPPPQSNSPTPTQPPVSTIIPSQPQLSSTPAVCNKAQGDANCDGQTDLVDYEIWRKEFTGELTTKNSDFNLDQRVSVSDFEIWRRQSYNPIPTHIPVPPHAVSPTPIHHQNCTITASHGSQIIYGTQGDDIICVPSSHNVVYASHGNDTILVTSYNNYIDAGGGNDRLDSISGHGNNFLDGSSGSDTCLGKTNDYKSNCEITH